MGDMAFGWQWLWDSQHKSLSFSQHLCIVEEVLTVHVRPVRFGIAGVPACRGQMVSQAWSWYPRLHCRITTQLFRPSPSGKMVTVELLFGWTRWQGVEKMDENNNFPCNILLKSKSRSRMSDCWVKKRWGKWERIFHQIKLPINTTLLHAPPHPLSKHVTKSGSNSRSTLSL